MTRQLYEEALADVKRLKEVAEDNAKKALIEAVAPRIKDLIESELLREDDESKSDNNILHDEENLEEDYEDSISSAAYDLSAGSDPSVAAAISMPDDEGKVTLDLDALSVEPKLNTNEFEMSNESVKLLNPLVDKINSATAIKIESKLFQLFDQLEKFSGAGRIIKESKGYLNKISELTSEVENTYQFLQESAGSLQDKSIYEEKLEKLYKELNKLAEQTMKKTHRSLNEADITLKLTGVPDDLDLDSLGVDLISDEEDEEGGEESEEGGDEDLDLGGEEESEEGESEEGESEEGGEEDLDLGGGEEEEKTEEGDKMESRRLSDNLVVEIDENMLRREIGRMKALREAKDDVQAWGHGAGKVSPEFEDDDMGDPFVDIDLTTEGQKGEDDLDEQDGLDEQDSPKGQDDLDEQDELAQAGDDPSAVGPGGASNAPERRTRTMGAEQNQGYQAESIRRRIASERLLQLEAKKKAKKAKKEQQDAKKQAQVKENQAQASAKKGQKGAAQQQKKEAAQQKKKSQQMAEAYAYYANKFNESVRRTNRLATMLAEVNNRNEARRNGASKRLSESTDKLREKLAETNLFNTKLLYSNKLLQNESLTKRQKAEVIERLDEARSEREVRLVYESLIKALSGTSRTITEGSERKVMGSSSQATRPASTTLNEGYEADRWARLAGIK